MSQSVNEESRAAIPEPAAIHEPVAEATTAPPEMRRKLAHMVPGAIPFVMWLIPHDDPLPLWNLAVVVSVVAILVFVAIRLLPALRRHHRESWVRTCLTYAVPPLATLLIFPARAEYASVVISILAFGDSAAAIAGRALGKVPLPWNPAKTWIGFLAFMLVAGPIASVAFWGEAHPGVPWSTAAAYGMVAAILGAVAESCDWRLDDNIRVSLGALAGALIVALVHPTVA
jgi:dolichol kinase